MARRARIAKAASLILVGLLTLALVAGCGGDKATTKDMPAQAVLGKVKVGMTEQQVKDELGDPSGTFNTATGATARFLEYDSKQGVVAVSIDRGVVTSARALGTNDVAKPVGQGGESGAEDVPRQFGN